MTTADAARLAATLEATRGRPPAAEELAALVDRHVSDEGLLREARAPGLDHDDAAVRQRLARQMRFVRESVAEHEPADAELHAHMIAHPDRFRRPPLIAFVQGRVQDAEEDATLSPLRGRPLPRRSAHAPCCRRRCFPARRRSPTAASDRISSRRWRNGPRASGKVRWAGKHRRVHSRGPSRPGREPRGGRARLESRAPRADDAGPAGSARGPPRDRPGQPRRGVAEPVRRLLAILLLARGALAALSPPPARAPAREPGFLELRPFEGAGMARDLASARGPGPPDAHRGAASPSPALRVADRRP